MLTNTISNRTAGPDSPAVPGWTDMALKAETGTTNMRTVKAIRRLRWDLEELFMTDGNPARRKCTSGIETSSVTDLRQEEPLRAELPTEE